MALRIITADERLAEANLKTTLAIFGPSGGGKTTLMKTLPERTTLCLDLEAGLKSVQDWRGDSIPIRTFEDALDIACLIGGINPAADENAFFSDAHYHHLAAAHPDLVDLISRKRIVFVDSITDLTRQAMAWAKSRPEAFSDKTGKPDTRGAYGLLAREVIGLLKHLQHELAQALTAAGVQVSVERRAHLRVPLALEVLGVLRARLGGIGLGGEEGADLVGHLDQLRGVHAHRKVPQGRMGRAA